MLEIDGSFGEGGGQVLRTALTLSTLTGEPLHIRRIRAGRRNPGLAPQHLTNVLALAHICDADIQGAVIRSTEISFRPHTKPRPGNYAFDVAQAAQAGSAGSVTLIFQTLLLPLAFAATESRITLKGGTHVPWSPPFDYLSHVYLPTVRRMGIRATCRLESWGFYPVGGGLITAEVNTTESNSPSLLLHDKTAVQANPVIRLDPLLLLERGSVKRIWGTAVASNLSVNIAQRMTNRATNMLNNAGLATEITPKRVRSPGPGAGIYLIAEYEQGTAGFSALGERGKPSERVAEEAVRDLLEHHNAGVPVDEHLADQLLLPMALAQGRSEFRTSRVTRHLLTNAHIIKQFIPAQIEIEGNEGELGTVVVKGAGHVAN